MEYILPIGLIALVIVAVQRAYMIGYNRGVNELSHEINRKIKDNEIKVTKIK